MNTKFAEIFARLRAIIEPHAGGLKVCSDSPTHYCVDVAFSARVKKGYPIAWVKVGKNYVSYHFMPVYMFPKLREGMSEKLRARMQGKACFNFKTRDDGLFEELSDLTAKGFLMGREAGFV